jgi:hypothetical protein
VNEFDGWHVAVLIPARNEEMLLERCLHSVETARQRLPAGVTSDVIVVADSCNDRTLEIARGMLGNRGLAVKCEAGIVGVARALASVLAISRLPGAMKRCWLANTDADCDVPPTWLCDQLRLATQGAEAIAGVVSVDSFAEHGAHVAKRFRQTYKTFADGTHPHVHGANLGLRADVYESIGGWKTLRTAEDHCLWNRLRSRGHDCRAVARLSVVTSGRIVGRAPDGFAGALAAHNEGAPA